MSSGERPIGAAKGKQSNTKTLCQTPPPCTLRCGLGKPLLTFSATSSLSCIIPSPPCCLLLRAVASAPICTKAWSHGHNFGQEVPGPGAWKAPPAGSADRSVFSWRRDRLTRSFLGAPLSSTVPLALWPSGPVLEMSALLVTLRTRPGLLNLPHLSIVQYLPILCSGLCFSALYVSSRRLVPKAPPPPPKANDEGMEGTETKHTLPSQIHCHRHGEKRGPMVHTLDMLGGVITPLSI